MPTAEIIPTTEIISKCFLYGNPLNFLNACRKCVTIAIHICQEVETETQRLCSGGIWLVSDEARGWNPDSLAPGSTLLTTSAGHHEIARGQAGRLRHAECTHSLAKCVNSAN